MVTGKKRLVICLDHDSGDYIIDTPDGQLSFDLLGKVLSDFLLKFFDPDNPPPVSDDGVIKLSGTKLVEPVKVSKKGYVN